MVTVASLVVCPSSDTASPPSTGVRGRAVVRRGARGAGSPVAGVTKPTKPAARAAGAQTRARRIIGAITAAT